MNRSSAGTHFARVSLLITGFFALAPIFGSGWAVGQTAWQAVQYGASPMARPIPLPRFKTR